MFYQPTKTVDSIMEAFSKTVTELRELSAKKKADNESHVIEIDKLQMKVADNTTEAQRADAIADKLEGLMK